MVRRCCIVTCRNGRSECDERVSFFKVPSEQSLFDKWARAVGPTGSSICKSSAICERHFRDDEIRRESVLRDSDGNVIFQRPLIKFSLVKEAIPSIFDESEEENMGKKRRKRRAAILDYPENSNTTANFNTPGNFIIGNDGNLNLNYNNILVTFNDNQTNGVNFNVSANGLQSQIIPIQTKCDEKNSVGGSNNMNVILDATSYLVNGQLNTFNNIFQNTNQTSTDLTKSRDNADEPTKSLISIYIKPHEADKINISDLENANTNEGFQPLDISIMNKDQEVQKLSNEFNNFTGLNLENTKEVTIIVPEEEIMILHESNKQTSNKSSKKNVEQPKVGTVHYPLPESNIQMNIRAFDLIFYNSHKIKLPNAMWGYHKNSIDKDIIIFSKAKWFKSDILIPPIYEKQVVFHESDNIKIYINSKFSPLEVRRPKDIEEIELILKHVDETMVCSGGPNIGECDTAHCAQKDYAVNRWRHKLCPIIVTTSETICKFCSTINQVLRYPKKKKMPFGRRPPAEKES